MKSESTQPNVLLIMPDQMRGDCLSLEDHPVLQTPHIDSIGEQGTHFTRAYTTCPSCIPARRSLLTGQFPVTNGMVGYREGFPLKSPTLPERLRDAGYATAIVGRYMHQSPPEEAYGFQKRVLGSTYIKDDDYAEYLDRQAPDLGGARGIGLSFNGRDASPWPLEEEHHPTAWTVREARRLLAESASGQPLFLTASFYAPHPPLFPPGRYMDQFLATELPPAAIGDWETPPPAEVYESNVNANHVVLEGEELRHAQAGYFGLIKQIDDLLPGLLGDFKAKSKAMGRPWVVVFTTDHGEMLGDHHLFRKCEPYEASSRIPFLIQGAPELGFTAGASCTTPVCLEDIMPTLLELAGATPQENIDGRSLVPVLRGEEEAVRDVLHCEHARCYDAEQAFHLLTDGKQKYIWRSESGREHLFDLCEDPDELHDLSLCPDRAGELTTWRNQMIAELSGRPEGFTDGTKLIAGRAYDAVLPHAQDKE